MNVFARVPRSCSLEAAALAFLKSREVREMCPLVVTHADLHGHVWKSATTKTRDGIDDLVFSYGHAIAGNTVEAGLVHQIRVNIKHNNRGALWTRWTTSPKSDHGRRGAP